MRQLGSAAFGFMGIAGGTQLFITVLINKPDHLNNPEALPSKEDAQNGMFMQIRLCIEPVLSFIFFMFHISFLVLQ